MTKIRRWRKEFPYFKIQLFNPLLASWKDQRGIFETAEAAARYISSQPSTLARIIIVESEAVRSVHPGSAADSSADLPQSQDPSPKN